MTRDATFEDGAESALFLKAFDQDGVQTISALVQDAVFPATEIAYDRRARKLSLLINRFRWEDRAAAERQNRSYERVQSLLIFDDVYSVASTGFARDDRDLVLSVLALVWEPGEDGTGRLVLELAGDGAIGAKVECVDVTLRDMTRPYAAASGKMPEHPK